MIWEEYLTTVHENDPWEIAFRWASFASHAVQNMDFSVVRTKEYVTAANDLLEAVKLKDATRVDWLAEVIEPKMNMDDNSFFVDQYLYEHDMQASNSHNMALTGFASCLSVLSAWGFTKYKSQLWEDNKQMSVFPGIVDDIDSSGYLSVFRQLILGSSKN